MRPLKRIIVFYFINLTLFTLSKLVFHGFAFKDYLNWGIWIMPLVSILVGTAIGFLIFLFINNDSKINQVYTTGVILGTLLWNLYLSTMFFSNWKHNQNFGNIESNHSLLKDYTGIDERAKEKKLAFSQLEKKYNNPNDIILSGISSKKKDTVVLGLPDSICFVKFYYSKKGNDQIFKSFFSVYSDSVYCYYYEKLVSKAELDKFYGDFKKTKKRLKEDIESLPDSIREKINDDMIEYLKENKK